MKIQGNHPSLKKQESTQVESKRDQNVSKQKGAEQAKSAHQASKAQSFTTDKIKAKVDSTPDMDMDKIKAMKDKIKNGDYAIDFKKLANNLLKDSIFEDKEG